MNEHTVKPELELSIVIPVYRSQGIVGRTVTETVRVLRELGRTFEVILVNDASPDKTWEVLKKLASDNPEVRAFDLARNYGQHSAVLCGFSCSRGKWVVTMDDDFQNPPNQIPKLLQKAEEGFEVVFGKFVRKQHGAARGLGTKLVGYLNQKIFNKPQEITLSNFRIIHRDLIDRILSYRTSHPYIPGLILLHTNNMANVEVEHLPRADGKSNYTLLRILSLVFRLLFNYSSFPLRVLTVVGSLFSIFCFGFSTFLVVKSLFVGNEVPGWASSMVLLSFIGGILMLMLGMIGEYLARILVQVSGGQSFHIRTRVESS